MIRFRCEFRDEVQRCRRASLSMALALSEYCEAFLMTPSPLTSALILESEIDSRDFNQLCLFRLSLRCFSSASLTLIAGYVFIRKAGEKAIRRARMALSWTNWFSSAESFPLVYVA